MSNDKKNTTGNAKVKSNDMQLNLTFGIESGKILTSTNEKLAKANAGKPRPKPKP
ncbi:hypothetical protein [Fusobacterium pseudoperiodonticum]|uniref:hypothetical protein n=1 Tax=Fusobacterium pseudoperiodonticum TaxID=2663009 RepID=UPI001292F09C|nr:hypothetical protein [Fusobacterium pseudoperiodonticum]